MVNNFEEQIGNRLENHVKGLTSYFACGGRVKLEKPVSVTHRLGVGRDDDGASGEGEPTVIQVPAELREGKLRADEYQKTPAGAWSSCGRYERAEEKRAELLERQRADFDGLLSVIPRASFGKGGETLTDATVRDALQLKAEHFEMDLPQEKIDGILVEVKEGLALQTDLVAEPYSLNVYQKGGKFVKHKDTPRGDDMIGTLVICLPSWFTGGELAVSLGGETEKYFEEQKWRTSWGSTDPPRDPCEIEWCAFFSDVDHEIRTVEDGIRITAAYLLRRKDRASASSVIPRAIEGREQSDLVMSALLDGLRNRQFLTKGGKIGFPCLHLYTNTEVFPRKNDDSSQTLTDARICKLKGRDLMMANAFSSAGLSMRLQPYLMHADSDACEGDWPLSKFLEEEDLVWLFQASDRGIKRYLKAQDPRWVEEEADLWILHHNDGAKMDASPMGSQYSADGYFGNEASDTHFYVKTCLMIEVPPYTEARGHKGQEKPPQQKKQKTEQ